MPARPTSRSIMTPITRAAWNCPWSSEAPRKKNVRAGGLVGVLRQGGPEQLMTMARTSWPQFLVRPPPDGGDAQLLQRFVQRRDEGAFATLMERHGPMVLGVCRRVLRDQQDVDDAFQATFLVLLRKAAALRRPGLLGNWLYGVAYRVALQARAGAARWRALAREVEDVPAAEPVDAKVWDELRPMLDEEVNRLPEKYRAPVVLCYLEGKTYT